MSSAQSLEDLLNKDYNQEDNCQDLRNEFVKKKKEIIEIMKNTGVDNNKLKEPIALSEKQSQEKDLQEKLNAFSEKIKTKPDHIIKVDLKHLENLEDFVKKESKINYYKEIKKVYTNKMKNNLEIGEWEITIDKAKDAANDFKTKLDAYTKRLNFNQLINSNSFFSAFKNQYDLSIAHIATRKDTKIETPIINTPMFQG